MNGISQFGEGIPLFASFLPPESMKDSPMDRLNAIQLILMRTLEAMKAFSEKKLSQFDPIVGDQACQIRALKIAMLAKKKLALPLELCQERVAEVNNLQKKFKSMNLLTLKKLKAELEPLKCENGIIAKARAEALKEIMKNDPNYKTVNKEFAQKFKVVSQKQKAIKSEILDESKLEQNELLKNVQEITVDKDLLYILEAYFMTLVKVEDVTFTNTAFSFKQHIIPKKLRIKGTPFCARFLEAMTSIAKKDLAIRSLTFVKSEADKELQEMVAKPRMVLKKGQKELPFYYLTRVVFERALELEIPILLKVRNIKKHPLKEESFTCNLLLEADLKANKYKVVPMTEKKVIAIIVEAFSSKSSEFLASSEYQKKLFEVGGSILDIVNFNTSNHPQYTDQEKVSKEMFDMIPGMDEQEKKRLIETMDLAKEKGFSLDNPSTLCIDHVFCNLVGGAND